MTIAEFDHLNHDAKKQLLLTCCGSPAWVDKMMAAPAVEDLVEMLETSEEKWYECTPQDWLEAFKHHPKIGDVGSLKSRFANTAHLAASEQAAVSAAPIEVLEALAKGNKEYEKKFGYIFIICATGKTAIEMLALQQLRLLNTAEDEMQIAAEEQNSITKLRLQKLFL